MRLTDVMFRCQVKGCLRKVMYGIYRRKENGKYLLVCDGHGKIIEEENLKELK